MHKNFQLGEIGDYFAIVFLCMFEPNLKMAFFSQTNNTNYIAKDKIRFMAYHGPVHLRKRKRLDDIHY